MGKCEKMVDERGEKNKEEIFKNQEWKKLQRIEEN